MDVALTHWINGLAGTSPLLDNLLIAITNFGVPFMVVLVVAQWWLGKPQAQSRYQCITAGASLTLGLGLAQIMLLFIHRDRPYESGISHLLVPKTVDWSFPSDHAIASFAIVFAYALNGSRYRTLIFFSAACVVCFSRVFVGMHYASDIVGGAAVALCATAMVRWFYPPDCKANQFLTKLL